MYIEDGVQLGELQQFRYLRSRIAEFQRTPHLPLNPFALWARLPLAVVIFENRGAAGSTYRLVDSSLRHDEFTEPAAVDVGHILQVEQNFIMAFRNFVANRLPENGE